MTELTIVMAVYGQPGMLSKQMQIIGSYPAHVREKLSLVIVDDCGDPPVFEEDMPAMAYALRSAKLFRITQDIPWNQMGARNLGMHHASGWCLMIDPDMVFDGDMMDRMIQAADKMKRGQVCKWSLKHKSNGKLDTTSPNTWMLHRDDFFDVGGYDEDFAGNKGWSDVQLLDVLRTCYKLQHRSDLFAHFYSTKDVSDAMVTSLDRSTSKNRALRLRNVLRARSVGGWAKWAKGRALTATRLRFPWQQIYPTA